MPTNQTMTINPQPAESPRSSRAEKCAGDYSADFHGKVIRTFAENLSMKETARLCRIPKYVVDEILHARDFIQRRPPTSAAHGMALLRRVA